MRRPAGGVFRRAHCSRCGRGTVRDARLLLAARAGRALLGVGYSVPAWGLGHLLARPLPRRM